MEWFLLSMQAAGMVTSFIGNQSQKAMLKMGRELEQSQLETNLEALRLESKESSVEEMKQLRKNLGSQIALNAARGNRGGSSFLSQNESVANFEHDERVRRMNLLTRESQLRANDLLSGLHTTQSETQLGQSLTSQMLNTVSFNSLLNLGSKGKKSYGMPKLPNPFESASKPFTWGI